MNHPRLSQRINPAATKIAADKKYISISNQENDKQSAVNSIEAVYAGLLRNVKEANIQIVEDATGKVIFEKTEYNIRKSSGAGSISPSSIDVEFKALDAHIIESAAHWAPPSNRVRKGL